MHQLRHACVRGGLAALILILAGLASACHSTSTSTKVMVTVTPSSTAVALEGTSQFFATVLNATDTTVTWQVNGVTGGNTTCGTISTNGVYTAPAAIPTSTCYGSSTGSSACTITSGGTTTPVSGCVLITAVSNQDTKAFSTGAVILVSGVSITVTPLGPVTAGTGESLKFIAKISGSTNLGVNWLVNATQGGTSTVGTINSTTTGDGTLANAAVYTAPATVPNPATVNVTAQSIADTSQSVTILVTISTSSPPTLTDISPSQVPAGAYFEDIYLTGTNFLTTTSVLWSGTDLSTVSGASVIAVDSTVLRARIPSTLLTTPGTFTVTVQQQNPQQGTTPPSLSVQVVPVRPVLLSAAPSAPLVQNSNSASVQLSGGYYTPATLAEWNGHFVPVSPGGTFPFTLQATLGPGDLSTAGLYPIAVRTPSSTQQRSAINLPVRPSAVPVALPPVGGFSQSNGISGGPVAVGVNDVTGTAVVVDQGTSTLDVLNSAYSAIASQVPVGAMPTSVAVDGLRNIALVTSPTVSQSISSISRAGGMVTVTLSMALTVPGGNGVGSVAVTGVTDPTFNGTFVALTGSGTTTLTWAQASPDAASTGGSVGTGGLSVVDLSAPALTTILPCVGLSPVAVGVDEIHGRALVVSQNGSGATILDTAHPMACPVTQSISSISRTSDTVTATFATPVIIPGGNGSGIITISGVSDSSFNGTFVVLSGSGSTTLTWSQPGADASSSGGSASTGSVLSTVFAATGTKPQVGILPQMGWAIVTPGGGGVLTVVDMLHSSIVFTSTITTTTQGVAVNTETKTMLLAEPSTPAAFLFSLLNQVSTGVTTSVGNVATAVNPLTNVGIFLNPGLHQAIVLDMSTPATVGSPISLGSHPIATAIDAATDLALVADDADGTVTVIDLGATRSRLATPDAQILQVNPLITMTSGTSVPITVIGAGFNCPGSQIRVEESAIPLTSCTSRELTGTIPTGFLTQPRRLVVDVQNSPGSFSNVVNVLVGEVVQVGASPFGVGIDQDNDRAVVANSADGTASVIDISPTSLSFGSVISTVTVGTNPLGVAVISRLGTAVVTNNGSSSASVIDMTTNPITVPNTVTVGGNPSGIGATESQGLVMVTNTTSNSINLFSPTLATPSALGVDPGPLAAAISPDLELAVVVSASSSNDASILDISTGIPVFRSSVSGVLTPTGAEYDPVSKAFLLLSTGSNSVIGLDPVTLLRTSVRTGVAPSALGYDYQAGLLVTLNGGSKSFSVLDLFNGAVRDVLPITGSALYSVSIHRRLEYMVISDSANNQVLVFPLPR